MTEATPAQPQSGPALFTEEMGRVADETLAELAPLFKQAREIIKKRIGMPGEELAQRAMIRAVLEEWQHQDPKNNIMAFFTASSFMIEESYRMMALVGDAIGLPRPSVVTIISEMHTGSMTQALKTVSALRAQPGYSEQIDRLGDRLKKAAAPASDNTNTQYQSPN